MRVNEIVVKSAFPIQMTRTLDRVAASYDMTRSQLIRRIVKRYLLDEEGASLEDIGDTGSHGDERTTGKHSHELIRV